MLRSLSTTGCGNFNGEYPTPGGYAVLNKAYINFTKTVSAEATELLSGRLNFQKKELTIGGGVFFVSPHGLCAFASNSRFKSPLATG